MMNKRGQGLSMETIIIAILVLLVLVFVIIFFTSGFGTLATKIKETMFGAATSEDINIARENCRNYCEQAKAYKDDSSLVRKSAYCTHYFKLDLDGEPGADRGAGLSGADAELKNEYVRYYCSGNHGIVSEFETIESGELNIACPGIECGFMN